MSAINIVLNAVDKYSSTLTGLNQGLELVTKGLGLVKDAAGLAFGAIAKGVEFARVGGAFDEQRNQFENLAKSYKLNGQEILDVVKTTSANTVSEFDSISVATRALAAGFKGPELNDALTYVKRWSESTGESFTAVAERVFTSISSGRYSMLRQMGLVIENGAKLDGVTKAMSEGLERFGDTGFNTADKLDALTASQDDFYRKLGQGINQSEEFQDIMGSVSDTIVDLVKSFNPQPISVFLDLMITGSRAVADIFLSAFPQIRTTVDAVMSDTTGAVKDFSTDAIDAVFAVVRGFADATNTILDILDGMGLITFVEFTVSATLQAVEFTSNLITRVVAGLIGSTIAGLGEIVGAVRAFAQSSPLIAESVGLDAVSLAEMEVGFKRAARGVENLGESFAQGFSAASEAGQRLTADIAQAAKTQRFDLTSIDNFEQQAKAKLEKINFSKSIAGIVVPSITIDESEAEQSAKKIIEKITKNEIEITRKLEGGATGAAGSNGQTNFAITLTTEAQRAVEGILSSSVEIATTINNNTKETVVKAELDTKKKEQDTAGISDSSVFAALVRIIKNALVSEAAGEGTPLVVFA